MINRKDRKDRKEEQGQNQHRGTEGDRETIVCGMVTAWTRRRLSEWGRGGSYPYPPQNPECYSLRPMRSLR